MRFLRSPVPGEGAPPCADDAVVAAMLLLLLTLLPCTQ
jgi:hypothetical protein